VRDYIVVGIILCAAPVCLFYPYFGVLMWSWIAYFNPHRYAWGFATSFPVALVIAVPTLVGAVFTKQGNRTLLTRETLLLLFFWTWTGVTFMNAHYEPLFADHLEDASFRMIEFSKMMVMTVLTIYLVSSKTKLKYLLIVTAFSFGLLALKGTIFGILTGGQFRVWGPPNSFVADNNDFGLALNMSVPMLFFLARDEENRKLKIIFRVTFFCCAAAVLLTYSRGALLGLTAIMATLALKSRHKLLSAFLILMAIFLVISFAPTAWMARMQAFLGGTLDASAQERLTSWAFAWNLAKHYPITGAGFECFTPNLFAMYSLRDPRTWLAGHTSSGPHSIYFQVMAEQGFVGLAAFLGLMVSCIMSARRLRKRVARNLSLGWMVSYSNIVEVSIIGYMVSGAFLGRAYFDLFWQIVGILITLKILYKQEARAAAKRQAPALAPAWKVEGALP
jgi:putative inorganic carbon (hco3(-)) transporter